MDDSEEAMDLLRQTVDELLNGRSRHCEVNVRFLGGDVTATLRNSIVNRRGVRRGKLHLRDVDIMTIEATPTRQGLGTKFLRLLVQVAREHDRGVFLEQTITDASRAWAAKLVQQGLLREWSEDNFLAVFLD